MREKRIESFYFVLCLFLFFCLATPMTLARQPPVKKKQVDVITSTTTGLLDFPREAPLTVDVRDVAINLYNEAMHAEPYKEDMYTKARTVLREADNAYLSSETVHLLKTHLATDSLEDVSVETRLRAIQLLGYSRNLEAVPIIVERLHNDPVCRVRSLAATRLGGLAGDSAIPDLLRARVRNWKHKDRRNHFRDSYRKGVLAGLGKAGGKAVPILIRLLKNSIKTPGGRENAYFIVQILEETGDRRAISPLIEIILQPASPSAPSMELVRLEAAEALAQYVMFYGFILKRRGRTFAEGVPVTPKEDRKVTESDRNRIREALETAGYDVYELTNTYPGFEPITDPELKWYLE